MAKSYRLKEISDFEPPVKSAAKPSGNRREGKIAAGNFSLGNKLLDELTLWKMASRVGTAEADQSQ